LSAIRYRSRRVAKPDAASLGSGQRCLGAVRDHPPFLLSERRVNGKMG